MPGPVYNQKGGSNVEVDHAFDANSDNPVANSFLTDVLGGGGNYTQPSASIDVYSQYIEKGTLISDLDISLTFNKNDAGNATAYRIYKDNQVIANAQSIPDLADFSVINSPVSFKGEIDHEAGPIKNNDLGIPDAAGQIQAGTVQTPTRTYTPELNVFLGKTSSMPNDSASVRSLPVKRFNYFNSFNYETGTVDKIFAIALPASKTSATSLTGQDSTNNVSLTYNYIGLISVQLPNNSGTQSYRLYALQVDNAYPSSAIHTITLN